MDVMSVCLSVSIGVSVCMCVVDEDCMEAMPDDRLMTMMQHAGRHYWPPLPSLCASSQLPQSPQPPLWHPYLPAPPAAAAYSPHAAAALAALYHQMVPDSVAAAGCRLVPDSVTGHCFVVPGTSQSYLLAYDFCSLRIIIECFDGYSASSD